MPSSHVLSRLAALKARFDILRRGKAELLRLLDESEIPESVFNSNAIENSTLTLEETEQILLAVEISRHMNLREVHEAQNLARVTGYLTTSIDRPLDLERLQLLHRMLLGNINDDIAGRFRKAGEYVRVGSHIAPAPEAVEGLLQAMFVAYGVRHQQSHHAASGAPAPRVRTDSSVRRRQRPNRSSASERCAVSARVPSDHRPQQRKAGVLRHAAAV